MPSARSSYLKVGQYMTTAIFTVQPDDAVQLVADLMGWERVRHVPVEDRDGRLVGLVSYRSLLRFLNSLQTGGKRTEGRDASLTPVSDVMRRDVLTVTPETETLDAIRLMRRYRIGCLPVVQDGHLCRHPHRGGFHGDRERSPRAAAGTEGLAAPPPDDE